MGATERIPCVILGAGGHAVVVIDAMAAAGKARPIVILDADARVWGTTLLDVPVKGGDDLLPQLMKDGIAHVVIGLGGVGDNGPRQRLFDRAERQGFVPLSVIHPGAIVSPWATVGPGSVLLAGAIVNARARLGRNVILNTGAIVEHDCLVGDHVHMATGARVAGGVRIGAGAHVGAGAVIRQGLTIGPAAIVAAGAVVVRDVAGGETVMGVPASSIVRGTADR
jgi:sugar O-acyltransferase (sialic acid O-acetyltransferase NeuD family)